MIKFFNYKILQHFSFSPLNKSHPNLLKMAPAVVLVLALFVPAFSLPFTIPEYAPEIQIQQETPVSNSVPQIQPGVEEKTGVPVPNKCSAGYPVSINQDVVQPATKVQDAPVNVEQAQVPQTETLFLPPQPAPVTQVDQIVRPVIVPAEAIASGRVIIMAVEPIQQRAFPDVIVVPQQQGIVTETPIQHVQSVEKQTPYHENYSPVQQIAQPNVQEVPERQSQVQPETSQQVYPERQAVEKGVDEHAAQVQPAQEQVVRQVEPVEKQIQSGADYNPVTHAVEPAQRVQTVETVKQEQNVQSHENPHRVELAPHQQVYTSEAVPDNVQKQVECAIAESESQPQQRVNVQEPSEQTHQPEAEAHQQQTYSVQPEQVVQQIQSVEPQKEVREQVPQVHAVTKTENQQVHDVPQQVSTYATSQVYNFGDKIPQQHPVETSVHQEQHVVEAIVVKDQI